MLNEAHLHQGCEAHTGESRRFPGGIAKVFGDAYRNGNILAVNEEGLHLARRHISVDKVAIFHPCLHPLA